MPFRRIGKYRLRRPISKGGMGRLYRARDATPGGLDRDVALKVIRPGLEDADREEFVEMFIEEGRVSSLMTHANLIHIYDFGRDGETFFLIMELVEGRNLAQIVRQAHEGRGGSLPIRYVLHIVEQVTRGLEFAHRLVADGKELGLVHRDVSPSNILVSFDGAVKLADFGVALIRRANPLTRGGVIKGKTGYMAPEYLATGAPDRRSDVFSLGVVLWEALCGNKRLFGDKNEAERVRRILKDPIPPPSTVDPLIPKALDDIVMRALARDPDERYKTARDFGNAITAFGLENRLQADEVDLGKELRRRFPHNVPATAMDLRGLTRKTLIGAARSEAQPLVPARSAPSGPTPATVESGLVVELSTSDSTAPKATDKISMAAREILDARPDVAEIPSITDMTTAPEFPRPELPAVAEASEPLPPVRSGPSRRSIGAVALGAAVMSGAFAWWQQRPKVPTPIATPAPSATATATASATAVEPAAPTTPSPLKGESAGERGPQATPTPTSIGSGGPSAARPSASAAPMPPDPAASLMLAHQLQPSPTATPTSIGSGGPSAARPSASAAPMPPDPAASQMLAHQLQPSPTPTAKPPPHHPAPRRHLKPGILAVIAVHPWVQVFVDGTSRGYTPQPSLPISAGKHKIVLSNEEVHMSRSFTIFIPESGHLVIRGDLKTLEPGVPTVEK